MFAIDFGQGAHLIDVQRRVDSGHDGPQAFGEAGRIAAEAELKVGRMNLPGDGKVIGNPGLG